MFQFISNVLCTAWLKLTVILTYLCLTTYSKICQYFVGLNEPPNIFISSENIFVKNCVSHCLQQSLKQIVRQ